MSFRDEFGHFDSEAHNSGYFDEQAESLDRDDIWSEESDQHETPSNGNKQSSNKESDPLLEGGGGSKEGKEAPEPVPAAPPVPAPRPNMMDYSYLDGLRGIGAFVVYLAHFLGHFYSIPED